MSLSTWCIARPVATGLLTLGLALLGAIAYPLLPVAPLPQIDYPIISVSASLPGASADTMAATVATPLERTLGSIAGLNEITSQSSQGSTRITLQFDLGRDIDSAARAVQAALNNARTLLPSGMPSQPTYRKVNPADPPIVILALRADTLPLSRLFDQATSVLAQRLSQVEGIGDVGVSGGALPAVRVAVDPNRLTANGLSMEQVRQAVVTTHQAQPKGVLEDGARQWLVGASDEARQAKDYAPLVLAWRNGAAVRLQDVAQVSDSVQDVRAYGSADGRPAVLLNLQKAPNANILDAVARVKALLPQLRATLPPGATLEVLMERTANIRGSIQEVQKGLALSVALVIGVVLVFMRSWQATLIPLVAVPVVLVSSFAVMYAAGYSLDNLSLMALTVAVGFVVDDCIVVMENIARHQARGLSRRQAALAGTREISFTLVSISLALAAAFIPVVGMDGIVGRLLREFALVAIVTIGLSLLVSLTTTPMLAARWLPARPQSPRSAFTRRWQRGCRAALATLLRRPGWGWALLVAVIAGNTVLYRALDKGFFPQQDAGRLIGFVAADQGISFQAMRQKLDAFVDIVRHDPAVAHVTASTGGGGQRNGGSFFVVLKPRTERGGVTPDQVIERLRPQIGRVPGAALYLRAGQELRIGARQSSSEYQYTLQADDGRALARWEPRIRRAMTQLRELADVDGDRQDRAPQTTVVIDRDAAARAGVTVRAIDAALNNAFGQRQIAVLHDTLNQYRVVLELETAYQQSPQSLTQLFVPSSTGTPVPLATLARIESTLAPLTVNHEKGTPAMTISFNLAPGVSLSQATQAIDDAVARLGVPTSVRGVYSGTANAFRDALASQPVLLAAALVTIYLLLGMLYESLLHPLTILSALPSAGLGAMALLWATKTEFTVVAMIGVVMLIGIVLKNAILLVDFALARQQQAAARGRRLGAGPAIYRAAQQRLRPILMTTVAAQLAALPLAAGLGAGAELRQPLGLAIVGGLLTCPLLTLFITPVVFSGLARLAGVPRGLVSRLSSGSRPARPFPRPHPLPRPEPTAAR